MGFANRVASCLQRLLGREWVVMSRCETSDGRQPYRWAMIRAVRRDGRVVLLPLKWRRVGPVLDVPERAAKELAWMVRGESA